MRPGNPIPILFQFLKEVIPKAKSLSLVNQTETIVESILPLVSPSCIEFLEVPPTKPCLDWVERLLPQGCHKLRCLIVASPTKFFSRVDSTKLLEAIKTYRPPLAHLSVVIESSQLDLLASVAQALAPRLQLVDIHGLSFDFERATTLKRLEDLFQSFESKFGLPLSQLHLSGGNVWLATVLSEKTRLRGGLFDKVLQPVTVHTVEKVIAMLLFFFLTGPTLNDADSTWLLNTVTSLSSFFLESYSDHSLFARLITHVLMKCSNTTTRAFIDLFKSVRDKLGRTHDAIANLHGFEVVLLLRSLLQHEPDWLAAHVDLNHFEINGKHLAILLIEYPAVSIQLLISHPKFNVFAVEDSQKVPLLFTIIDQKPHDYVLKFCCVLDKYTDPTAAIPEGLKLHQVFSRATSKSVHLLFSDPTLRNPFLSAFSGDWKSLLTEAVLVHCYDTPKFLGLFLAALKKLQKLHKYTITVEEMTNLTVQIWEHMIAHTNNAGLASHCKNIVKYLRKLPESILRFVRGEVDLECQISLDEIRSKIKQVAKIKF